MKVIPMQSVYAVALCNSIHNAILPWIYNWIRIISKFQNSTTIISQFLFQTCGYRVGHNTDHADKVFLP